MRLEVITVPGAPHGLKEWNKFMPGHAARTMAGMREILDEPGAAEP